MVERHRFINMWVFMAVAALAAAVALLYERFL